MKENGYILDLDDEKAIEKYLQESLTTYLYYLSAGVCLLKKEIGEKYDYWFINVPRTNSMRNVLAGERLAIEFQRVIDYYLNYIRDRNGEIIEPPYTIGLNNIIVHSIDRPIKIKYKIIEKEWNKNLFIKIKETLKKEMPIFNIIKNEDDLFREFYE